MPAEWEAHEATWLGWPHNLSDWPGRFAPIPWVYGEIVRKLAEGERVRILVPSRVHEAKARRVLERVGAATERVEFFRFPSDRGWTRDFGPICVKRGHPKPEVAVARFRFNGWAKYPDHRKDDLVAERAAKALGLRLRRAVHQGRPVVLEGGAIDVDGTGTLLTTEECLLDPHVQVRNPGFGRADYEQVFRESLGATHTLWLGKGIAGDDTHGHVDDLCRFVSAQTIVLCRERSWGDANYRALEENRERLQAARLADGSQARGGGAADARPARLRWAPAAGELRQLLHRERCGAGPDLQRPAGPRRARRAGRARARQAGRRDPRGGAGMGARNAPLPDAADASGGSLAGGSGGAQTPR